MDLDFLKNNLDENNVKDSIKELIINIWKENIILKEKNIEFLTENKKNLRLIRNYEIEIKYLKTKIDEIENELEKKSYVKNRNSLISNESQIINNQEYNKKVSIFSNCNQSFNWKTYNILSNKSILLSKNNNQNIQVIDEINIKVTENTNINMIVNKFFFKLIKKIGDNEIFSLSIKTQLYNNIINHLLNKNYISRLLMNCFIRNYNKIKNTGNKKIIDINLNIINDLLKKFNKY